MDADDKNAIIAVQKGDINAFEMLVRKYTTEVVHFISARTRDENLVDDVVQIAFIKLYKAVSKLDISRPLKPYLFQIAKNELYEQWQKNKRTTQLTDSVIVSDFHDASNNSAMSAQEASDVMQVLKDDQKKALVWFTEGYSYHEIAKRLGKPINTVRTIIRRARLFIKQKLNV